jgi:hypothetical protein
MAKVPREATMRMAMDTRDPPGQSNIVLAWWMIGIGMAGGAIMGLWSFDGPARPPAGFALYDDLPRRLVRLAHIAAVALPALNLLYVPWMRQSAWGEADRRRGCRLLLFGTVALPVLLALAAFWRPALFALAVPVFALVAASFLLAAGLSGIGPEDAKGETHADWIDRHERGPGAHRGAGRPGRDPAGVRAAGPGDRLAA